MKKTFISLFIVIIVTLVGCESTQYFKFGKIEDTLGVDISDTAILYKHSKFDFPERYAVAEDMFLPITSETGSPLIVRQSDRKLLIGEAVITESLYQDLWVSGTDSVIFFEKSENQIYLKGTTKIGLTTLVLNKHLDTSYGFMDTNSENTRILKNAKMVFDKIHNLFYVCCALGGDDEMKTYIIDSNTTSLTQISDFTWSIDFIKLDINGEVFYVDGNLYKGDTVHPSIAACNIYIRDDRDTFYISKDTDLLEYRLEEIVGKWLFPTVIPANWLGFQPDGTPFTIKHMNGGNYSLVFGTEVDFETK
ncbi:MAG TPA: hypothetical protein PKV16_01045 [Caldisericia bacterium]|nr:hypothetical protein [Caldisericia bacterium]HPF49001.1 hypothetical protein [Caldisericia bacterium]HPI83135.1 hypothetical protein [Caldisericia bacterium]HPQ92362.1 hypothetical protein [Caldisericia bacterium]HRV74540.1 hypothetical protein [Caldisericia bacterium]